MRQGRAFGMHVILGSQTLGGQYSLPKATLGQMAVRIALQCSEADAHLILSEDNTAARLLTRPGEAIYNDANGMMEGNNLFQVVWLSDERREKYLERIQEMCKRAEHIRSRRRSSLRATCRRKCSKNPLLNELLEMTEWPEAAQGRFRLAGGCDLDQGPHRRRVPASERQQRLDRRPERRGGARDDDDGRRRHRRTASAGRARRRAGSTCSTAARSIRPSPDSSDG